MVNSFLFLIRHILIYLSNYIYCINCLQLLFRFGQFIVATLPQCPEKHLILREGEGIKDGEGESILLRNRCLQLLHSLLFNGSKVNVK